MIGDATVLLVMVIVVFICFYRALEGMQKGKIIPAVLFFAVAAFIAYGLYLQCPGVAVFARC